MKKNLNLIVAVLFSSAILLTSCKKDEVIPDAPSVTAPTATTGIEEGQSVDVSFALNVPGGYASSAVSAVGGTATITTEPSNGALNGNVVVNFTANTAGAASVTLTVTDKNAKSDNATAVLSVEAEQLVISVNGNITTNTIWETGKTYILESRIAVVNGVTLTIQPGVVVKGNAGSAANATALIIAQGAKIDAQGTATSPIIFTSIADQIQPGQIASPNLEPTLNGLWGGIIVLGKAHISYQDDQGADQPTASIEGVPANDPNGVYGGNDDNDNSGILKYISIRHGGTNIGEGNEINGLTLGGVGSGTVIENVEIISNQDDGIEWFGGTVNVKNAIVWNTGDDAIDADQAWAGTIDNFVVINPGDECFELDGPEGSYVGAGYTIKNGTVSVGSASGLIDFDDNTDATMMNVYFLNLADNTQDVEGYAGYFAAGNFTSSAFEVTLPNGVTLAEVFEGGSDAITTAVASGAATVGADLTQFATWSWAAVAGALTGL
jgi:hypothetical protein